MGDFADSAQDQGIAYYQTLAELKQGITNLLAVGMYHLFEQHYATVRKAARSQGSVLPKQPDLTKWPQVDELRLLANAVKHADGSSAAELRKRRPDYFVDPDIRRTSIGKWAEERASPLENPLGGTDLFVSGDDLHAYRDALRGFWEGLLPDL